MCVKESSMCVCVCRRECVNVSHVVLCVCVVVCVCVCVVVCVSVCGGLTSPPQIIHTGWTTHDLTLPRVNMISLVATHATTHWEKERRTQTSRNSVACESV